jgi:uncharacterized protein
MTIVLDTNVLVSALLSPFGPPARTLDLLLAGEITLAFDDRLLIEYHDVLTRDRFGFEPGAVAELLAYLEYAGRATVALPLPVVLPDPDDIPFLEVAAAAEATLITVNGRHYPPEQRAGVLVLTPAEYVERWRA